MYKRLCSILTVILLIAGCSSSKVHKEYEGPLSVKGTGGFAASAENFTETPWYFSSSYQPCIYQKGVKEIELVNIEYRANPEAPPLEVIYLQRELVNASSYLGGEMSPYGGELTGLPIQLDPIHGFEFPGEVEEGINGMRITEKCSERDLDQMKDFWVIAKSDEDGMEINSLVIDYLADGKPYTMEVFWNMTICGRKTKELNPYCD